MRSLAATGMRASASAATTTTTATTATMRSATTATMRSATTATDCGHRRGARCRGTWCGNPRRGEARCGGVRRSAVRDARSGELR
jgi:uncharacterized low-complexity protein